MSPPSVNIYSNLHVEQTINFEVLTFVFWWPFSVPVPVPLPIAVPVPAAATVTVRFALWATRPPPVTTAGATLSVRALAAAPPFPVSVSVSAPMDTDRWDLTRERWIQKTKPFYCSIMPLCNDFQSSCAHFFYMLYFQQQLEEYHRRHIVWKNVAPTRKHSSFKLVVLKLFLFGPPLEEENSPPTKLN